ncbi:hypothetical protein SAMN04488689_101174 [Paenibacillus sp. cl6col]|nr:hypothetical protein SAMN04488689_101174 [Paenibacillus sp. cl6col]
MSGYFFFLSMYVSSATRNVANMITSEKEKFIDSPPFWREPTTQGVLYISIIQARGINCNL